MRSCRRYRCFSNLRQGISAHSSLGGDSGALVCSMLLPLLHSTLSGLRQPILDITPGLCFSDHPTKQRLAVGTCSYSRPGTRAICWLLRSERSFSAALGLLLSAGFRGSECRSQLKMSVPILVHLDQAPPWLRDTCVNSFWLVWAYDGSATGSLALAIATCLGCSLHRVCPLSPFSPASRIDDQSLPRGECCSSFT